MAGRIVEPSPLAGVGCLPDGYPVLSHIEMEILLFEKKLGHGSESRCLPGWIKSFGKCWTSWAGRRMTRQDVGNLLHTLVAARRRNWLMSREIERLKLELSQRQSGEKIV